MIYGDIYTLAGNVLSNMKCIICMIKGAFSSLLNSFSNEVGVTKINGIVCLLNAILNLILIYYLSYIGASIATSGNWNSNIHINVLYCYEK